MKHRIIIALLVTIFASPAPLLVSAVGRTKRISRQVLEDKIRGGWAGQMIGVSFGAPTEFHFNGRINEEAIKWKPDMVSNAIVQDDLYVEMTFTEVLDRIGLQATTEQFGDAFRTSGYELWHANAGARRLLNQGMKAPLTGDPRYNIHANDIDFQIESDFIGLMTPGLPQEANIFADRVGHVMNYGDGVYGGMFFAGMYAAAFFESDTRKVVELGLKSIPAESEYGRVIRDVLTWSAQHPDDWKLVWKLLKDKWDKDDPCTEGALNPFNIDAKLNGAYVALGLIYGKGDFSRTMDVSTRAGQDSDCNPSSAGGILGVILGYSHIPEEWKSGIPALADKKFDYTNYSFNSISESTLRRALEVVRRAGGKVTENFVEIPAQEPKPWKLEQWNPGKPQALVPITDPGWAWMGKWTDGKSVRGFASRVAEGAGSEVVFNFEGVAVAIVGPLSQSGGRADVFLDGVKQRQLDAYIPVRTHDDALWHTYGLQPGKHSLRIVARDDADSRSTGRQLIISKAIVYSANTSASKADQWEPEIRKFEEADRGKMPPKNGIVFVGSSSIRLWKNLEAAFPGIPSINRGFGGSELSDSVTYARRIITPYSPRMVVLYAGDNDLAAGKMPDQVFADFKRFVTEVRRSGPKTRIGFISIKPSTARVKLLPEIRETNRLIREFIARDKGLIYFDVFAPMLDSVGQPRRELFIGDGLHMNAEGYEIWRKVIGPGLR